METKFEDGLRHHVLTQKSAGETDVYGVVEQAVNQCIEQIKELNINARIANAALNIGNQLVLAQVYVERKNGFSRSPTDKFGTSPTVFNIQVRFPFGLTGQLGDEAFLLPDGDFVETLQPFQLKHQGNRVSDDVQRDFVPEDLILGPDVEIKTANPKHGFLEDSKNEDSNDIQTGAVLLFCTSNPEEKLEFPYSNEEGKGYELINGKKDYYNLLDYNTRLKIAGVYPLFYSISAQETPLRYHQDYPGYTQSQARNEWGNDQYEKNDKNTQQRKKRYTDFINQTSQHISDTVPGARLFQTKQTIQQQRQNNISGAEPYILNITEINGLRLHTDSNLPVIRLRPHQTELLFRCHEFIKPIKQQKSLTPGQAAKIDMGVGAGKTFFISMLLQHLRYGMRNGVLPMAPSFCMAPNEGVASVMEATINRQSKVSNITAKAMTGPAQMPDAQFMNAYQVLSNSAAESAQSLDRYLQTELQQEILTYCQENNLHPNSIVNFLGNFFEGDALTTKLKSFKDSIHINRLLLIIEGQKYLTEKTGMLGVDALYATLEQLEAIEKGIASELLSEESIFFDAKKDARLAEEISNALKQLNYNQKVPLRNLGYLGCSEINFATITANQLTQILNNKYKDNTRAIRDVIIKIAYPLNQGAAVLCANSGGLGNTYTEAELKQQINAYADDAAKELRRLAGKENLTAEEHYIFYLYINEIFSTIPDKINFKRKLNENQVEALNHFLYITTLQRNMELIGGIRTSIQTKLNAVGKARNVVSDDILNQFGLSPNLNVIEAANWLAGVAALTITGEAKDNNAALLLSHVPVFTPEGLACYFEQLALLEGTDKVGFQINHGIYQMVNTGEKVSPLDIRCRIEQIVHAVMLADEIHDKQYAFLYDPQNPFHQRISAVTKKYCFTPFRKMLPHRLGMSGTMNEAATKGFGNHKLYSLPMSEMMKQGCVKQIHVDSRQYPKMDHMDGIDALARTIVIDYFSQGDGLNLFFLSKGLLFSKCENPDLNEKINHYFNVLLEKEEASEALLGEINKRRCNKGIGIITTDLLRKNYQYALAEQLFALYLEYMLSKTPSPKEASDIIGKQNELYQAGMLLMNWATRSLKEGQTDDMLAALKAIQPQTITEQDVNNFLQQRLKDDALKQILATAIMRHKNSLGLVVESIGSDIESIKSQKLMTTDLNEFESGKAFTLLAGEAQRTGYSHEPVGIICDVPSDVEVMGNINRFVADVEQNNVADDQAQALYANLRQLSQNIFSPKQKNQMGGRALRTPQGKAQYLEYLTGLHDFVAASKDQIPSIAALQLEISFADIFTADQHLAEATRRSVKFNRKVLELLQTNYVNIAEFHAAVCQSFTKELHDTTLQPQYEQYIVQRLPLFWAIKYQPHLAVGLMVKKDEQILESLRKVMIEAPSSIGLEPIVEHTEDDGEEKNSIHKKLETEFRTSLNTLTTDIDQFIKLAQSGNIDYQSSYARSSLAAVNFIDELEQAADNFFSDSNQDAVPIQNKITFINQCVHSVEAARTELESNQELWDKIWPSIKAILGVLAVIALGIPAILVEKFSSRGYLGTFFPNPEEDSVLPQFLRFEQFLNDLLKESLPSPGRDNKFS